MRSVAVSRRHTFACCVALGVAATLFSSCDQQPSASPFSSPASPDATTVPTLTGPGLEEARRFRTDFGLRSDEGWIRTVAADASSDRTTYGVPLTAEEIDELGRRAREIDQIVPIVVGYGEAHETEWGGAYIDQESGSVVALFTDHVDAHRLALLAQVWPKAKLQLRQVRWTKTQLETAKAKFRSEEEWISTVPADVTSLGINIEANRIDATLSSPNPGAVELVLTHFGWEAALLKVSSDGTGAKLLKPATLEVNVTDESGRAYSGLACIAYPDLAGATDPRPDPLPLTDASGRCVLSLRATGYWIEIERPNAPGVVLATIRAVMRAGESASIGVVVPD
jgi:hypothetical protein